MWKYPIRPMKFLLYNLAARLRRGGDIVDQERHKMENSSSRPVPAVTEN